jgi:hypothetical protein
MPLLPYFTVAGTALVGLLFVVDAMLADQPVRTASSFRGIPELLAPPPRAPSLVSEPAPEPDMTSAAVRLASADSPPTPRPMLAAAASAPAAPPKPRVAVRKRPKPPVEQHDFRDAFAWSARNFAWSSSNRTPWRYW